MRIQHNIMAMNAYRNYNTNTSALSKNLEKLSSGYKINRAGDDAAGLAISEKMRAQITGLNAAQKNVKDGISLVKTAEGAMQEIQDMLNRMDYLATQSANGTYDNDVDRANLQKEVNALKSEIDRIADSANFNGIKLLDGTQASSSAGGVNGSNLSAMQNFTVSALRDGTTVKTPQKGKYEIDLSQAKWTASTKDAQVKVTFGGINKADGTAIGDITVKAGNTGAVVTGADVAAEFMKQVGATGKVKVGNKEFIVSNNNGKLTFSGVDTRSINKGTQVTITSQNSTNVVVTFTGVNGGNQAWGQAWVQLEEPVSDSGPLAAQSKFSLSGAMAGMKDGSVIKIGDTVYTFAVGKNSAFKNEQNVVDLTDMEQSEIASNWSKIAGRLTGVAANNKSAMVNYDYKTGDIYLTEKIGGMDRNEYDMIGDKVSATKDAQWKNLTTGNSFVQTGTRTSPSEASAAAGGLQLQIGDTADTFNQLHVEIGDMHVNAIGVGNIDISTQGGATNAIEAIKKAINNVSSVRGDLGAIQNRLEHTQNNLSVMAENIQDAESTIRDTDIADEMMAYTKNNILIQSAQAMLAQANAVPQGVLQLLG